MKVADALKALYKQRNLGCCELSVLKATPFHATFGAKVGWELLTKPFSYLLKSLKRNDTSGGCGVKETHYFWGIE